MIRFWPPAEPAQLDYERLRETALAGALYLRDNPFFFALDKVQVWWCAGTAASGPTARAMGSPTVRGTTYAAARGQLNRADLIATIAVRNRPPEPTSSRP